MLFLIKWPVQGKKKLQIVRKLHSKIEGAWVSLSKVCKLVFRMMSFLRCFLHSIISHAIRSNPCRRRFETSYSAVDIRTECHELEKHAMIIRFTKFHECEETDGAGWLIQTANGEVFQNSFHPAGSEVLPQKLIADCAMLMKLLEGFHILSL